MLHSLTKSAVVLLILLFAGCSTENHSQRQILDKEKFLADLKLRTFNFFWELVDTPTYQIPDRYPTDNFSSVAATGFGLPSYIIGIANGFITREQGAERVLKTLQWLANAKQGSEPIGVTGYKGFFYHFLTYNEGVRFKEVELSTIDTGLLMAGVLSCMSYFDADNEQEKQIRELADKLYKRVEWDWAMNGNECMSMGWHPEKGFLDAKWAGYNEAMILVIMALGSPTHPIHDSAWTSWCKPYNWQDYKGFAHINFEPLFGHQYSHQFIDFKGITDTYMKTKGIDYFENSRRATLSNRAYCAENPDSFVGYSSDIWGLTACDGPGDMQQNVGNKNVQFFGYRARGACGFRVVDDGTIAPTAAGGSIPFAPDECIRALYAMYTQYGDSIYDTYGFRDAFNLTFNNPNTGKKGWYDIDYLGIDQGPILIQLENQQTGLIWNLMKKNPYIVAGLKKAGFTGGWLDN